MTLNIGPQHPATHGTLRIVVTLDGEQVICGRPDHGLHAPRLREAHRGPHLPAGHHAGQPHRLARQLRQRGAVHPRRRAADGHRGAAPGPVDPHDPVRAQPHRQHRRCSSATSACSSARITPVFYAFRDREYVLNQIEAATGGRFHPNFDRIGGLKDDLPKGWIDETKAGRWRRSATSATRWRTCSSATRSSRPAPAASASSPPTSPCSTACRAPTCAPAASTGTSAATSTSALAYDKVDWKVWTHPDGDRFARFWVRLQETREATKIVDQLLDGLPVRPDHGQGAAHHQGARGRGLGGHREPARRDGLLRRLQGRSRPVPGEDPHGQLQQHRRSCRGCCAACTCPTSSRSSPRCTSSSGTSTGDRSPRPSLLGVSRCCGCSAARSPSCCPPARSCTCSCSR